MKPCGFNLSATYTTLPSKLFTKLPPERVKQPNIICINEDLASSLGLDLAKLSAQDQAALLSGNQLPQGVHPFAQAYAGHQFGHFAILGDGRAHIIGEHTTPKGETLDIAFKGSGRTPYSRSGDGRAALQPMLREYIISEALNYLGIPTTRSLAVVTTGQPVMRETALTGAILTRIAKSHIRVGTFAFAAHQCGKETVKALLDYTLKRHYPHLIDTPHPALAFINEVMNKQADLITHWMRVGFIHGVMNTDNMLVSGETIDYGPCAFMDHFAPNTVFSAIDHMGRYAYANQPEITQWNLARLAETLLPLIDDNPTKAIDLATTAIHQFPALYTQKWQAMMRAKLGLDNAMQGDKALFSDLLNWMQQNHADYTNTFSGISGHTKLTDKIYQQKSFDNWHQKWQARRNKNTMSPEAAQALMQRTNPAIIPRNHKVEQALEAANTGDLAPAKALLSALKSPYKHSKSQNPYQSPPAPHERIYQTFCGT